MNVDYNDKRFTQLEEEKQSELNKYNEAYDDLIKERDDFTKRQQELVDNWENTQKDIANKNLQYQQDLIEQQRKKAEQEYQREAKASYIDYQKEVDRYGVSRENVVNNGLSNSGYAESSKVDMYNTYQNRLGTARKGIQDAVIEFDNAIRQAQLSNDETLAQNALTALQNKLNIALEGFNYKSEQTNNKLNWNNTLNNNYYNRYQDVLSQINYENQQKEAIRQWEAEMAYKKEQDAISNAQNWASIYNSSSGYGNLSDGSISNSNTQQIRTNYYSGNIHPDAQYGTFASSKDLNGVAYQPNNVGGNMLSKSGMTVKNIFTNARGKTGASLANQNIWQTKDGKYYVWDGSRNDYIDVTSQVKTSKKTKTSLRWGW